MEFPSFPHNFKEFIRTALSNIKVILHRLEILGRFILATKDIIARENKFFRYHVNYVDTHGRRPWHLSKTSFAWRPLGDFNIRPRL